MLNHEDPNLRKAAGKIRSQVYWFSGSREVQRGTCAVGGRIVFESGKTSEQVMASDEVPLKGGTTLRMSQPRLLLPVWPAFLKLHCQERSELQGRRTPTRAGR